jgi:hypothetical protein
MMDSQMPFVPFQRDKNSYVLPKVSRSASDLAAPAFPIPPPKNTSPTGGETSRPCWISSGRPERVSSAARGSSISGVGRAE